MIVVAACLSIAAFAQSAGTKVVDASVVPQAVKDAQAANFPNFTVVQWREQSATGAKGTTGKQYLAIFNNGQQRVRARYSAAGKGIVAVTLYAAAGLPEAIKSAVATNYAGYTLVRGELVRSLQNGKEAYRITLRKGTAQLQVWMDAAGNQIKKEQVPTEMQSEPELTQ